MANYRKRSKGRLVVILERMWRCLGEIWVGGCCGGITAYHSSAPLSRTQAQKYLLNELCSCHIKLFFPFPFLSLSRDHLQKGKQLLSNKTQMYFTKEQWVGFRKEIFFLWSLIQPACSTTNCKILNYWLVPRMVRVSGPLSCMNNQEQGDREKECRRIKLFGGKKGRNIHCQISPAAFW